jgi:type 1 glutamine amidotransferase
MRLNRVLVAAVSLASIVTSVSSQERIRVMFLGDSGHHKPAERMAQIHTVMAARVIDLFYTDQVTDLTANKLAHYDCLILYANHIVLPKRHEKALLDFVAGGRGFVPWHCASACFYRSSKFVALVGGQFGTHGTGVFAVENAKPDHPVMRGLARFESWDETYAHAKLSADRVVRGSVPRRMVRGSRGRGCATRARVASSTPLSWSTSPHPRVMRRRASSET